ncbi:MAG: allantoinase [Solibacillus sp.]
MLTYDLIIRNGSVILEHEIQLVDLAIQDGKITKIEPAIKGVATREIDATGHYILPGVIDVHAHFSEPGREHWEGFTTGSSMMAAGGITTYFDMPLNGIPSTVTKQALLDKATTGQQKSFVHFGLWGGLVPGNLPHLKDLAEEGVIGFKAFISPTGNKEFEHADDFTLLEGMKEIAKLGKILALHAESAEITTWLTNEKRVQNDTTADAYLASRPIIAEIEAVQRALHYAHLTNCPLHFVHISSAEAVAIIKEAKANGQDVTLETCTHYLLFTQDDLRTKGSVAKCAPPLREQTDQKRLIDCMLAGDIDFVTSDHSPCPPSMKEADNIFDAWGGISGGQFTLLAMLEFAKTNTLPLTTIAKWTAAQPAKRFDLPTKGRIAVGMDADFAIIAEQPFTVTKENFFAQHKHSIYQGRTFSHTVQYTICNGQIVFAQGTIVDTPPAGQWVQVKHTLASTK